MTISLRFVVSFICCFFSFVTENPAEGIKVRHKYIACVEEEWDYADSGKDLVHGKHSEANVFLKSGSGRIGSKYIKAMYREFTDDSFKVQSERSLWLGLLGPVLKMNVGENMTVHFYNKCSHPYTVHAHGVLYTKDSEGALYNDKTSGTNKEDDSVLPGEKKDYVWRAEDSVAPQEHDPNCLSWTYHSHKSPVADVNSGLVGMLLVCKKGIVDDNGKRKDVDKDFVLLFKVFDENQSLYLQNNTRKYVNGSEPKLDDEGFIESNLMHSINGKLYGNLLGLEVTEGESVSWHMFGMGTEVDLHRVYFHGQTVEYNHHRTDGVTLFPAVFTTATMTPRNPGKWLINCQTHDHYSAGMLAYLTVKRDGVTRQYFIAAEEVMWNYAPSGTNKFQGGKNLTDGSASKIFFERSSERIGGTYKKARYVEYTNSSFTTKMVRNGTDHLGFLGPIIKGQVGDTIRVVFKNLASRSYSIQAQGLVYDKSQEGSVYDQGNGEVKPNSTFTYTWTIPKEVSPTAEDPDCISYMYTSAVDPVRDTYSGLVGPLLVCKKDSLDDTGKQKNIDKEFFLMFSVTDENLSWYIDDNILSSQVNKSNVDDEDFKESNLMHGINGYLYANLQGLEMCKNDKVSWHVMSIGTEVDLHSVSFHGQTFNVGSSTRDSISIIPGQAATFSMTPDNEGSWALVCHTNDHYNAGMVSLFEVNDCNKTNQDNPQYNGVTRYYYIAVVEMEWDYAPSNKNLIFNSSLTEAGSHSEVFTNRSSKTLGKVYQKALYREFTDSTFSKQKPRSDRDLHLGMLGPFIKAEVGDTIVVVFKNNAASRPYSIHPHGVFYKKDSEGSSYEDGSAHRGEVAAGATYNYTWKIPPRSGPGDGDLNCTTWAYTSSIDLVRDTNSGLIGPLIVCRPGTLGKSLNAKTVDREFALLFTVTDESESWYLDENIKKNCIEPCEVEKDNEDFKESNLMHGINGYIFNNIVPLTMNQSDVAFWYLIGFGTEVDVHTVHFHGQTVKHKTGSVHMADVITVVPGTFETVLMEAVNPGEWLLHCHVDDHLSAGMEMTYTVTKNQLTSGKNGTNKESLSESPVQDGSLAAVIIVAAVALLIVIALLAVFVRVRPRSCKGRRSDPGVNKRRRGHENKAYEP